MQSLWARSPRDVWAVTSNSEVYRYDGSSWSRSDEASALGMMFYVGGHPDYNGIWLVGLGKGETQKYLFKFDDAIVLGCCSGARTTTASLGMINDRAKSQIPGLGYTVTYAVGNTFLTIWGMVLIMLLA